MRSCPGLSFARLMKLAPKSPYTYKIESNAWDVACSTFAEALAESAMAVTGWVDQDGTHTFGSEPEDDDTHTALLIDIQPIENAMSVSELVKELRYYGTNWSHDLADAIEKRGVKP